MLKINIKVPKINLIVQLAILFVFVIFFGKQLPTHVISICYAISLTLKEVLLFFLPFIIFSCLFHSLVVNQSKALKFIFILLISVCLSNFVSILAAYGACTLGFSQDALLGQQAQAVTQTLNPFWNITLPVFIKNEIALLLGLSLGLLFALFGFKPALMISEKLNKLVTAFLQKIFIPILPIFVLGFILKMQYEGVLTRIIHSYGPIILLVILANIVYSMLLFGIAAKFSPKVWLNYIKNVLPAGMLGFSTMSSLAAMPVTLNVAEKNTGDPEIARAIIPATVNIHMVGDSITIPILVVTVLLTYHYPFPSLVAYLGFMQLFMLAKFSTPGVPGGSILVILPLLESFFGFTPEMLAFVTTLYILFDPIITTFNVLGNSALVVILSKWSPLALFKKQSRILTQEETLKG
jgi:Na+/H+-dicarboxylate symporter